MPTFSYIAHDIHGTEKSGKINARNQAAAIAQLREKGLFANEVTGTDLQVPASSKRPSARLGLGREIRLAAAWAELS